MKHLPNIIFNGVFRLLLYEFRLEECYRVHFAILRGCIKDPYAEQKLEPVAYIDFWKGGAHTLTSAIPAKRPFNE